ncbi:MAG: branched-chain amino acid transport system permease protein livM, partial [Variibacter sp.]|nr:branched-chain amino acid transport system permease protein livM [Variibacter sp.]
MEIERIFAQALTGLASASNLFLISCGLTIIFGVTRIVNFAHGSIYMLGAYFAVTLFEPLQSTFGRSTGFWLAMLGAILMSGMVGVLLEVTLLRRLYRSNELFQILATFGVVLIVQDLVIWLWGPDDILGPRAPGLAGFVQIGSQRFPSYNLFMICVGPAVLALLWMTFRYTKWGVLLRAATEDKEMVGALGVRDGLLMTSVVALGAALAGLAGALQMPVEPANSFMDVNIITEAFVVTVIGGMGSLPGAFIASLIIGMLHSFGVAIFPKISLVLIFLVMAVVLVCKPWGLLGTPEVEKGAAVTTGNPAIPFNWKAVAAIGAVLAALPLVLANYQITLATEVIILSLFAFSLNFIMGNGGIVSFGHAAFFGLGAYGAALVVYHLKWPMELALLAGIVAATAGAIVSGWFVVRLAGVYAAMLTLAFAQIVWSAAFQWNAFTGGDNGVNGIWPSDWLRSRV